MKVYLNSIDGIADALTSIIMTRRNWTREKETEIRQLVNRASLLNPITDSDNPDLIEYNKKMSILLKNGIEHITLLSFIDFSITTEGIHRGGQDDIDAHGYRYHNRIIRMSTRAKNDVFTEPEMSDYYKDKILPLDVALAYMGIETPDTMYFNGDEYVRTVNGYVKKEYEHVQDAKRGLYMLSIPSNFILRCNLKEFAHVYKMRNENGWAHPEVKEWAETVAEEINCRQPLITKEYLLKVQN